MPRVCFYCERDRGGVAPEREDRDGNERYITLGGWGRWTVSCRYGVAGTLGMGREGRGDLLSVSQESSA